MVRQLTIDNVILEINRVIGYEEEERVDNETKRLS